MPTPRWPRARLPRLRRGHRFAVIAHRGAHEDAPENSLAALRAAIAAGVDFVECDLRTTRDGHIVILHDRTVDRTTSGEGPIAEKSLDEAKALGVATFSALVTAARGRIGLYLDCKDVDPAKALGLVQEHGMARDVLVYDDPESLARWKSVAPEIPVMTSPPASATTPGGITAFLAEWPVELLDGPATLTAATIAAASAAGAKMWPDIMSPDEGPRLWEGLRAKGFTGFQSDQPAGLAAWLREHRLR